MIPINRTARLLSRISVEVDDYIERRAHPLDNVYSTKDLSAYDTDNNAQTYVDITSYDEDYAEYADGYPSDAEDDDECIYDSDGTDN